jgi:hypothetical protein
MSTDEILEQRRLARAQKSERDARLVWLHQLAAEAMAGAQSQAVRERALSRIESWEQKALCSRRYIVEWRRILDLPPALRRQAMLRDGDEGIALRQNTPFSFLMKRHEPG